MKFTSIIFICFSLLLSCSTGDVVEEYSNGKKKKVRTYFNHTQKDFKEEVFFEDGTLKEITYYKNSLPDSLFESFYPSGKQKGRVYFKDGKEFGLWSFWYPNGELSIKGESENGKYLWVEEYFDNRQLSYRIDFKPAGVKNGEVIYYYPNGNIHFKGRYLNDEQIGLWQEFNTNQFLINEKSYVNGKLIKNEEILDAEFVEIDLLNDKVTLTTQREVLENSYDTLVNVHSFLMNKNQEVMDQIFELQLSFTEKNSFFRDVNFYDLSYGDYRDIEFLNSNYRIHKFIGYDINVFYEQNLGLLYQIKQKNKKILELKKVNNSNKNDVLQALMLSLKSDSSFNIFSSFETK